MAFFAGKSRDVRVLLRGNGNNFFSLRNQHFKKVRRMSIAGIRDHYRISKVAFLILIVDMAIDPYIQVCINREKLLIFFDLFVFWP